MNVFLRWWKAEWYKLLHSSLLPVHLLVPAAAVILFTAYFMVSSWGEEQQVSLFLQVLAMAYPALIGVITAMDAEQEARAGAFSLQLAASSHKSIPHAAKILVLLLAGFVSTLMAVCGFGLASVLSGITGYTMSFYVSAALFLFLGNMPLYLLHYLISYAFGRTAGLVVGITGSLLSALMITGLGAGVWYRMPWGLGIRLVTLLASQHGAGLIGEEGVCAALCFIAGSCVFLAVTGWCWSIRWEGRIVQEEI